MSTESKLLIAHKLETSKVFQGVVERAFKIGKAQIFISETEKYNNPLDKQGNLIPDYEARRPFDVEGHSCSDIHGFFNINVFSMDFIRSIGNWLQESFELRSVSFFLETVPFFMPWNQWVWTVDSMRLAAQEVIERRERQRMWKMGDRTTKSIIRVMKQSEEQAKSLSREAMKEILLADGNIQISTGIFVNQNDPTVFSVDETLYAFDLKDGWSNQKLCSIIGEWFWFMGYYFPIEEVKNTDDTQPLKRFFNRLFRKNNDH
jgi:hypothetical protein